MNGEEPIPQPITATATEIIAPKDYPKNYTHEVVDIIKKALFNPSGKGLKIMGSMSIRSQQYASDVDCFEIVDVPSIDILQTRFKRIIRNLLDSENIYIGDIKLGNKTDWRIIDENAYMVGNKIYGYNPKDIRTNLERVYKEGVISKDIYNKWKDNIKENPDIVELREMMKDLRPNILRWKPKDVLNEHLLIKNRQVYGLKEALKDKSLFKLDFYALLNTGIYQEFSIIYDIRLNNRRLNLFPVNLEVKLKEDMTYYAKIGNWYKFLKRFFSLSNFQYTTGKDKRQSANALMVINEILNSDIGIVGSLINDIEALIFLMDNEHDKTIPISKAKKEIDGFIQRLSNVYTINEYIKAEPQILEDISDILEMKSKKPIIETLEEIKQKLATIINNEVKSRMDKIGLNVVAQ